MTHTTFCTLVLQSKVQYSVYVLFFFMIEWLILLQPPGCFQGESLREGVAKRLVVRYMENQFEIILLRSVLCSGRRLALRV